MTAPLELWGGHECTVNRVGDGWLDQTVLSGHQDRPEDLDLFASLGLKALRYPVLWERTEVERGRFDWPWADERLGRLRELGVRPIVGLVHHGSGPAWTDLLDPGFADGLARFAGEVAARYPWVNDWTPINEPLTTARFSALYGHWYPHATDEGLFWRALLNQIDATRLAMAAIRAVNPAARLVQTEDFGQTWGTAPCESQARFENDRRLMTWDLLTGRVVPGHPLFGRLEGYGLAERLDAIAEDPCPPDLIGLNHYVTSDRFLDHRTERYPAHTHGGNGELDYADVEAVRVLPDHPCGWTECFDILWSRYRLPIAVTECHLGCTADEQVRWLDHCWTAALDARRRGVCVEAVTMWSLLGCFDWNSLLTQWSGHYEPGVFDVSSGLPQPTPLAKAARRLSTGRVETNIAEPGWWARPDRILYPTDGCERRRLDLSGHISGVSEQRSFEPVSQRSIERQAMVDASSARAGADVIALDKLQGRSEPIVCLSHLRWNFVFQRPQHLMTRFAANRTVLVFEEPLPAEPGAAMGVDLRVCAESGVIVATPRIPDGVDGACRNAVLRQLLDDAMAAHSIKKPVLWYYTPMMLPVARHIEASAVVYDCMDELANFKFAPPELTTLERELFASADVVFTGGYSLYEAKQDLHPNIHPFPSSVDRAHFAKARQVERAVDGRPTLGFFGVIDERMNLDLIAAVADAHPEWDLQIVGPVVKISPDDLPRRPNVAYPGQAAYEELPVHLSRWDVALMPFAINESTRFISPTKTPEYLAAGRPVVSTPIRDVVRHYGDLEAVRIAETPEAFIAGCEQALAIARGEDRGWLKDVDAALSSLSWEQTQLRMAALVDGAVQKRHGPMIRSTPSTVAAPSVWPAARRSHYDALVVGAGFAGSVLAERLASSGKTVLLIDRRAHIGGNAFDKLDDAGVLIHQYGPHIFHTNSADIFDYLSRFTEWRPYEHRVLAQVGDKLVPMPINRTTLNALYGLDLRSDEQAEAYLASRAEPVERIKTSEDVVVNAIGRELYETFFRGYTRKQWGLDPSQLDKSVTARVPTRTNTDDRYFTDAFQAMPKHGYTRMFENMLDHPNIHIETATEYRDVVDEVLYDRLVFTGPIDEFFDHRYGALPYRSLRFRHETLDQEQFQPVATVNYPHEDTPYTRITEYKHLTGQTHAKTSITYEYPAAEGDPYYPIPRAENQALFKKYEALAEARPDVTFVGRLATYRYYNMDQVTGQALATFRRLGAAQERPVAVEVAALGA